MQLNVLCELIDKQWKSKQVERWVHTTLLHKFSLPSENRWTKWRENYLTKREAVQATRFSNMTEESSMWGLTLNIGRGCRGWEGAAVGATVGAGDEVTWSAGSASGTVCSVGRIVVDIFPSTPVYDTPRYPALTARILRNRAPYPPDWPSTSGPHSEPLLRPTNRILDRQNTLRFFLLTEHRIYVTDT